MTARLVRRSSASRRISRTDHPADRRQEHGARGRLPRALVDQWKLHARAGHRVRGRVALRVPERRGRRPRAQGSRGCGADPQALRDDRLRPGGQPRPHRRVPGQREAARARSAPPPLQPAPPRLPHRARPSCSSSSARPGVPGRRGRHSTWPGPATLRARPRGLGQAAPHLASVPARGRHSRSHGPSGTGRPWLPQLGRPQRRPGARHTAPAHGRWEVEDGRGHRPHGPGRVAVPRAQESPRGRRGQPVGHHSRRARGQCGWDHRRGRPVDRGGALHGGDLPDAVPCPRERALQAAR